MKIRQIISAMFILLFSAVLVPCQIENWSKLVVLESNREEVEKILGKPQKYFDTYGIYQTEIGEFSVWYAKGGCQKNVEGLQWNVPAQKLTGILFYPSKSLPLESYISNKTDFTKTNHPTNDDRFFYTSPDGIIIYQTIVPKNRDPFVYTIELEPSKAKRGLLCKNDRD